MAAIITGMALHGGLLPFGATFLSFSDYMRPAIRLAALSKARVIYVWTHDSIAPDLDVDSTRRCAAPLNAPEPLIYRRAHMKSKGALGNHLMEIPFDSKRA